MTDYEDLLTQLEVTPSDPFPGAMEHVAMMNEAAAAIRRLQAERDAARTVIERVRDWLGPESFWDDEADAPVYADLAEILDAAPTVRPTGRETSMTEHDYAALVQVLRKDASVADRMFGAATDKETLQAAADAIEALVGEADQHGAEAFRLARDLREARNEIARLTGQTFEIVDKAAIWDAAISQALTFLAKVYPSIGEYRVEAVHDIGNPYRKADN